MSPDTPSGPRAPAQPPGPPDTPGSGPGQPGARPPGGHPERARALVLLAVLLLLFGIGAALAVAERAGCLRRGGPGPLSQLPPPPAPDSAGDWLDTADSLMAVDPSSDPQSLRRGFDMWARTLASLLPPSGDTIPDAAATRALLDSLHLPGEVIDAPGDAGMQAVLFRPRSAVRTRSPYLFYRLGDRVGFRPLGLENAQHLRLAGWRADGELRVAGAAVVPTDQGPRPALVAMSLKADRGWTAWDTLPGPDSLAPPSSAAAAGGAPAEPAFVEQSGQPPLLVMRRPLAHGPFDECAGCPHRYLDRIWRVEGERFSYVTEQPEDTPYAALSGFLDALSRGGRDEAARYAWDPSVVEEAQGYRLDALLPDHSWRLQPGQQPGDTVLVATRLGSDSYRFHLQYDGSHWRVSALERAGGGRRP